MSIAFKSGGNSTPAFFAGLSSRKRRSSLHQEEKYGGYLSDPNISISMPVDRKGSGHRGVQQKIE